MKAGKGYLILLTAVFLCAAAVWMSRDAVETVSEKNETESAEELAPRVAISFDDGPHKPIRRCFWTAEGAGREGDVFLIGENISGKEEIVRRMAEEGHRHRKSYLQPCETSGMAPEAACEEIRKTSDLIQEITGKPAEYIRPPFGEWDKSLECGLTLFPVLWTVDTLDWTTENVSDVVRRGTEKVKDGDVILLHDCYASSVKAALEIIDTLKSRGFQFVTADELILE